MSAAIAVDADTSNTAEHGGRISAPMVAALEQAWSDIRTRHPQLPAVVVVLGAGSIGTPAGSLRLGHFAAMRWHTDGKPDAERLPEVFVGGEGLARGPAEVLATLLHEAAHALAHVRQIKDTSRQGRYHNARFKELAEELGIAVTKDPRIGWSPTTLTATTKAVYADTIDQLGRALRLYRAAEPGHTTGTGTGAGGNAGDGQPGDGTDQGRASGGRLACVCECGRRIRVAPGVLAAGPITCGVCRAEFTPA